MNLPLATLASIFAASASVACWTLSREQFVGLFGDDRSAIEDTGKKLSYLRSVASVAHLSQTQIFQMAQRMRRERFSRGDFIITQGERHGDLHGGGPQQIDPIFGYRVQNGRIHAGMVRVAFELTDIEEKDGATVFIPGSHKANFPMHPDHMSLEEGQRSPFLRGYSCPAGSALFFTENLCHAGPVWQRETPRVAVFFAYAHLATHWHRLTLAPEIIAGLSRERQAYFREPWIADFRTNPATSNTSERFLERDEAPINTEHQP